MISRALIVGAVSGALLVPTPAAPQSPSGGELLPGVLIIKRIGAIGQTSVQISAAPALTGEVYRAGNLPLISLWFLAYGQVRGPIFGAPDWFYTDGFDITGRREAGEDPRAFSRRALTEAFKLSMHLEMRPLYALVVADGNGQLGPGIKDWTKEPCRVGIAPKPLSGADLKGDSIPSLDDVPCGRHGGVGVYAAGGISLEHLAEALSHELNVVVRNATGRDRTARFAVRLHWRSEATTDTATLPSLVTALRDQLGLELRASPNPAGVVVIDHVEEPTVPGAVPQSVDPRPELNQPQ